MLPAGTYRQANPEESALAGRFQSLVEGRRHPVVRFIALAEILASAQKWKVDNAIPYPRNLWTVADQNGMNLFIRRANLFEQYLFGLLSHDLGFQVRAGDIDIGVPQSKEMTVPTENMFYEGLGAVPIVWIIIAIIVALCSGAVVTVSVQETIRQENELDYKNRLMDLDKWALGQPKDIQDKWRTFKQDNAKLSPEKKSWFDSLGQALSGAGLPIALALVAWALMSGSRSERSAA